MVYKKISVGFCAIVVVVIALGVSSQHQLSGIANDIDSLYKHPFAVSNAANNINFHLVSMHRHMKDVVLAQNKEQVEWAVSRVAAHEQAALTDFDIIFERFLGEQAQINKTYQRFVDWQPIRNEVINLVREGQQQRASAITTGKGASHVAKLNMEVGALVEFAYHKAQQFHRSAKTRKEQALLTNYGISIMAVILVVLFSIYVVRSLRTANKDRLRRNHLIDQQIMMATIDKSGNVIDISNALCRFLGCVKSDLIGEPSQFFDNSPQGRQLTRDILRVVSTGMEWTGEIQHSNAEHQTFWAYSSVLPNFNDNYQIVDYTNILNDVTNKKLSIVDKLTALPNRRSYDEILSKELRLAKRHDYNITLAIIDIDFFKKFNDRYGHPQGDIALQRVATKLMECLKRPSDYVFRIGGEEFALVFSRATIAESQLFLDKLRTSIEYLHIEHSESNISDYLTISIGGYVLMPPEICDSQAFYVEADKALYEAKKQRNFAVVTGTQNG